MSRALATVALIACAACSSSAPAPGPAIQREYSDGPVAIVLEIDRASLTAAESARLTFRAEGPEDVEIALPEGGARAGDFLLTALGPPSRRLIADGQIEVRREYDLEPLSVGEVELPAWNFAYKIDQPGGGGGRISTTPVTLRVDSVLEDAEAEIEDIAGPVDPPPPYGWLLLGLAAIAAGAWLALRAWRARGRQDLAAVQPLKPPHQAALEALDALLEERLIDQGQEKQYYERLSGILRRYIESRFGLPATERTTEEFLAGLRLQSRFGPDQRDLLHRFLAACDLVKFAQARLPLEEAQEAARICRLFIDQTRPAVDGPNLAETASQPQRT